MKGDINNGTKIKKQNPEITTVTMPGTVSPNNNQDLLYAVRLLEGTGAGIDKSEQRNILNEDLCDDIQEVSDIVDQTKDPGILLPDGRVLSWIA